MSDIIQKAQQFAREVLSKKLDPSFQYHNLTHTERVVKSVEELLDHHELMDSEREALLLAAWLHDTGYTKGVDEHEEESCAIATEFLEREAYDKKLIEKVCQFIRCTKMGAIPETLPEMILKDADASHFAKNSFMETTATLRNEWAQQGLKSYSDVEWLDENIKFFTEYHQFYTDYAKENWQPGKDGNLKKLKKDKKAIKEIAKKEALKAKFKSESPDRGIQTLFRVTLKNHLTLSDIADTKANILLSVNAIIISVALSNLIPKLDNPSNTYLIYPTLIFIVFSVVSMIMAVLATRPNITSGKFSKKDVENKKVNLLFFGNFHKMSLGEYEWAIQELVKDKEYIYSSLTKDLYFLGLVLNRKYKILRWTYTIFMIGIILSVLAFGVAFRFFGPERSSKAFANIIESIGFLS
ncbi:MAG: Pycsar system effector family protein [Aurantibacter sp.]